MSKNVVIMDVFFFEAFEEEVAALKHYLKPETDVEFTGKTILEYKEEKPPASLISIRTQSVVPVSWVESLSGILSRSTGYDHMERYLKKDLPCGYLPLYCSRAVAEQVMLMWMFLLRKMHLQIEKFSVFNRNGLTGMECEHKTLMIVGVGNIGYEVVKIGRGLGMEVIGVDIEEKYSDVSYVSLEEGLSVADIIVCAMNLTPDTINYFDYQVLNKAKQGVIFINISRGEISPSESLLRLLDENHIGGLGLDVYNEERELALFLRDGRTDRSTEVNAVLTLLKRQDVILTPHNAFNSFEAVDRKANHSVRQINHFLKEGCFLWSVPVHMTGNI